MSWRRLGVVVLAACACTTHDAPGDGAVDATVDAHVADAGHDDGRDAAAVDVGTDGPDAATPGWVRVTGSFPETTRLEIATADLVASTSFPIETCPDRAACRRIVQSWPSGICTGPPYACSPFRMIEAHGHHDGTSGVFWIERQATSTDLELWVVDDSGTARAGLRSRPPFGTTAPHSSFGDADLNGDSIALNLFSIGGGPTQDFVVVVPFGSLSFLDLGDVAPSAGGAGLQRLQLGDGAIAAEMDSLVVQRIPLDGSAPAVVTDGEGTLGAIVGQTIFHDTTRGSSDNVIHVARPGAASEAFVSGPLTHSYRIATDGTDLVWLEFDLDATSTATNYQIWTSPYAEHAADLVPRRLDSPAVVSVTTPIRVGRGYAAAPDGLGGLRIYRLADGYHADLPPPSGEIWFAPAYLGPTEIAVAAHRFADPSYTTQLCFIELDSLDWQPTP